MWRRIMRQRFGGVNEGDRGATTGHGTGAWSSCPPSLLPLLYRLPAAHVMATPASFRVRQVPLVVNRALPRGYNAPMVTADLMRRAAQRGIMSTEDNQTDEVAEVSASDPAPAPRTRKGGYPLIIVTMIAIGLVLVLSSSFSSGSYSLTIADLRAKADLYSDRDVKVVGLIKAGSVDIRTEARRIEVHFLIEDGLGGEVPVVYPHNPPDPFKEGREVIVEGTVMPREEGAVPTILCHVLTVKCPSKYQEEGLEGGDENYYREKYGQPYSADTLEAP